MTAVLRILAIALPALFASGMAASAAQLVMIDSKSCAYCARWNREVGATYSGTALGKAAPLRRVDARGRWPADLKGISPDYFTPTFVLIEDGKEVGRIRGYTGKDWFWTHLRRFAADSLG